MNNYINLKGRDTYKLGIKDENGIPKKDENGNELYIEFDLENINTVENWSKCVYLVNKAHDTLKNEIAIIQKKSDSPGKGIMTKNQEEEVKVWKKYYADVEYAMNLFLGENGVTKIFGDVRYSTMFEDLAEMFEPIMPDLKVNSEKIINNITKKYSNKEDNVLKDE